MARSVATYLSLANVESVSDARLTIIPRLRRVLAVIVITAVIVGLGAAAATQYGLLIVAMMFAIFVMVAGISWFVRDPVQLFAAVWLFQVLHAPLAAVVGYNSSTGTLVRQSTDVLTLLLLIVTLWRALEMKQDMAPLRFVLPGLIVAAIGLISSLAHPAPFVVTATGLWLGLKIWILLAIAVLLPWKVSDYQRVYRWFVSVGVVVSILGIVDFVGKGIVASTLHTNIVSAPGGGYRSAAVQSIFVVPGQFSLFMSLLVALAGASFARRKRFQDLVLLLLFAGVSVLSLRLKGVLSLAVVFLVIGVCRERGARSSLGTVLLLALFVGIFVYTFEGSVVTRQLHTYTSTENTARARLYTVSAKIAQNEFPLGAGFGRFASYPSRTTYSPVYYEYELNQIYGLTERSPQFIDDTSWPAVIGETGVFGLLAYISGFLVLVIVCYRRLRRAPVGSGWLPLAGLCVLAVVAVDSTGNQTLFDWIAAFSVALILGPILVPITPAQRRRALLTSVA